MHYVNAHGEGDSEPDGCGLRLASLVLAKRSTLEKKHVEEEKDAEEDEEARAVIWQDATPQGRGVSQGFQRSANALHLGGRTKVGPLCFSGPIFGAQATNCMLGVEREISISSGVMSAGTEANSGVLR